MPVNSSRTLGVIAGISGILLFSSKAVMVKMAYQYDVDSIGLLLLRMGFALPFYLIIALLTKPKSKIARQDYLWLISLGLLGYYLARLSFFGLEKAINSLTKPTERF